MKLKIREHLYGPVKLKKVRWVIALTILLVLLGTGLVIGWLNLPGFILFTTLLIFVAFVLAKIGAF